MSPSFLLLFLLLVSTAYAVQYRIVVHTKNSPFAGTDETVSINLHGIAKDGRLVESGFVDFADSTGAMFETNSYDHLILEGGDIENLIDVSVKIKKDGWYLDWWYLDTVKVWHAGNVYLAYFDVTFRRDRETYRSRNFYLECQHGFVETSFYGQRICQDRDECLDSCNGIGQMCKNTIGSFDCKCQKGFISVPGGCQDIDECSSGLGQCFGANSECANTVGSYRCQCKQGYEGDGITCTDFDECKKFEDNKCQQVCKNIDGGFNCACNKGYSLAPDKRTCLEINECQGQSTCDPETSVCYDQVGTFICMCKRGYQPSKVTANKCIPVVCPRIFLNDANVIMSPADCSTEGRPLHNKCTFSCKSGYSLASQSSKFATCNEEGRWDVAVPPLCLPLSCPRITPPKNGKVVPADCATSGALEGKRCYIYCNNGYKQIGLSTFTCHNEKYSSETGTTVCVQVPNIKCPEDVNTVLPVDKSTVALAEKYPSYTSTVLPTMIASNPPGVGPLFGFPEGLTKITMTAKNVLNETASCSFYVRVRDVSAPRVIYCPGPQYYMSNGDKITVTWPEPVFKDNVGIAKVFQSTRNDEQREPRSFPVTYQVSDSKGNQATCKFDINIKVLGCNFDSFKGADQLSFKFCIPQGPTNALCSAQCPDGKTFDMISTNPVKTIFLCSKAVVNGQSNVFPSCVDFIAKTGPECPEGFVDTVDYRPGQSGKHVCGKCPRGTFYDKGTKSCKDCPVNTYSEAEGQFQCTSCPKGKGTPDTRTIHVAQCIEMCPKGTKSMNGLQGTGDGACMKCPVNSFADALGSTECIQCPKNTRTDGDGKSSLFDCLTAPTVFFLEPVNIDALVEGSTVRFLCLIDGSPLPYATVFKQNPIKDESKHGRHVIDKTLPSQGRVSIGYSIENATMQDSDKYFCKGENSEGEVKTSFEIMITPKETMVP